MLGNITCFGCHLLTFFTINFFKKFFQEHYQCRIVWIQIRLERHFLGPDLGTSNLFVTTISRQQKSPPARKELIYQAKKYIIIMIVNIFYKSLHLSQFVRFWNLSHSKTCVKWPLSKRPKIGFQDQ